MKYTRSLQTSGGASAISRHKKAIITAITCLAALVVFCTVYALILPAATLTSSETSVVNSFNVYAYKIQSGTQSQVDSNNIRNTARSYTENGTTYYLIPVSTLEDLYGGYYTFDETDTDSCPFGYLESNANLTSTSAARTKAVYVQVDDTWYVQVTYTGNGTPTSYLFYTQTVETVNPSGTVINLFDYWTTTELENDTGSNIQNTSGINYNHALKFVAGTLGGANGWTGNASVYQNIVNRVLYNGYPTLSTDRIFGIGSSTVAGSYYSSAGSGLGESLQYLFDPSYTSDYTNDYRKAYSNVTGLLQIDDDGYYYYDSTVNYADFDEDTNSFDVYDSWAVTHSSTEGQFFPFNDYQTVSPTTSCDNTWMNHYLGMTLTTRFIQQYGGYTSNLSNAKQMEFDFTGDDDVWIFIDGVLVGDIGGIHDASSVSINFATGVVTVNGTAYSTIYDEFVKAGMESTVDWTRYGNTYIFEDGSYHTLKFFYLERGSSASDLSLKYNLNEYPATSVEKVDQYGDPVAGATFAVYAADSSYNLLSDLNGSVVTVDGTETYDGNGNMYSSNGTLKATALYVGTTDSSGTLTFVDSDNMPYTMAELKAMFGEYFILKEIEVPDGYRSVSDDTWLQIYNNMLICNNTYTSGTYASPNELITAPAVLDTYTNGYINYYDGSTTNGTLFAVVMKYTGDDVGQTSALTNQGIQSNWAAVYGNYADGFSLVDVTADTAEAYIQAAIEAALLYDTQPVFTLTAGGQMQLYLTDLPGDITKYYAELGDNEKENTEYIVAYFWTSASSLSDANASNTEIINSYSTGYEFTRSFGTTIRVPDLINYVQVQKLDPDGNAVNGATFAIYSVAEVSGDTTSGNSSTVYYIASDGSYIYLYNESGNNTGSARLYGTTRTGTYTIAEDGVITVTIWNNTYTINPVQTSVTGYSTLTDEYGMATFTNLSNGYYYVREVAVPTGYELNTTEVMTLVNDETVTANAGTADDGVEVARGTGYLVATLDEFAAEGVIDNTLSWIYAAMRVSDISTSFADADISNHSSWGYTSENYYDGDTTYLTSLLSDAYKSYLQYDASHADALYNYITNTNRTNAIQATRRIFTEVGWSHLEIYQDTTYGLQQTAGTTANYTDLSGQELTSLFSRSVYIRVTDQPEDGTLEISKTVVNYDVQTFGTTPTFTFTVDLTDSTGTTLTDTFTYTIYDVDDSGTRTQNSTGTIASGGTVTLTDSQVVVIDDIPYGTQYTVTETAVSSYVTTYVRDDGLSPIAGYESSTGDYEGTGTTASGTLYWLLDTANDVLYNTSTVDFTNTYLDDLAIYKVDAKDGTTPLEGAEFTITKTVSGTTYYYTGSDWTTTETTITTNANGYILLSGGTFFGTADNNTYVITEVTPPNGYELLASSITMVVSDSHTITSALFTTTGELYDATSDGNVITVSTDALSFTVTNHSGYVLPDSGGFGTLGFLIGGIALMGIAVLFLARKRRHA